MTKFCSKLIGIFIVFILAINILPISTKVFSLEKAVPENAYFKPLEKDVYTQYYFWFKNLSGKSSKIEAKIVEKNFPGGPTDKNWFTQFCYSNICFLDEGESPKILKPGERETMHVTLRPFSGAAIGEKVSVVLEVWPAVNPKLKERIEFYGITVEKKLVILVIGNKTAKVNDKNTSIDVAPFIDKASNRTLVPLRFIGEALGASIEWDNKERKAIYKLGDETLYFWVSKKEAEIIIGKNYSKKISLDVAPIIVNSRTFVPVRYVSELLGAKVDWDGKTQTITILFPPPSEE